jgi:hypothetical protein
LRGGQAHGDENPEVSDWIAESEGAGREPRANGSHVPLEAVA